MNRSGEEQEKMLALLDKETSQSDFSKDLKDQRECEASLTPHQLT